MSNGSRVVAVDGSSREVKNLGWLLRNWKGVESFSVVAPGPDLASSWDAVLTAHLRDGRKYVTPFASKTVLRDWLHRPVFRTCPLDWYGERTEC